MIQYRLVLSIVTVYVQVVINYVTMVVYLIFYNDLPALKGFFSLLFYQCYKRSGFAFDCT